MKILVAAKRAIDYNVKIRIKADGSGVETDNVKMSMNPFDEIAVEEAVRLKEKNIASETFVVSIGNERCEDILRHALALGLDQAILVQTDQDLEPLHVANVLKKIVEQHSIDLVILGKQSIDGDNNQTGQMLAALLDWPQATFASKIEIQNKQATVTREIDGGLETLILQLPAVITTDLRLNQPRYAALPNIMKAKRKLIQTIPLAELGMDVKPHMQILKIEPPAKRKGGVMVNTVAELIDKLKNEAGVL